MNEDVSLGDSFHELKYEMEMDHDGIADFDGTKHNGLRLHSKIRNEQSIIAVNKEIIGLRSRDATEGNVLCHAGDRELAKGLEGNRTIHCRQLRLVTRQQKADLRRLARFE